jgi:hypothetical protein
MVSFPSTAEYDAFKIISSYNRKKVCFLEEDIYKMNLAMYLQTGNPLIHRANTIIRRTIEAGLVDIYWSMVKWRVRLKSVVNSTDDAILTDDNEYFALALSHLKVAFIILTVGYILCAIVFIAELVYALISTYQSKRK